MFLYVCLKVYLCCVYNLPAWSLKESDSEMVVCPSLWSCDKLASYHLTFALWQLGLTWADLLLTWVQDEANGWREYRYILIFLVNLIMFFLLSMHLCELGGAKKHFKPSIVQNFVSHFVSGNGFDYSGAASRNDFLSYFSTLAQLFVAHQPSTLVCLSFLYCHGPKSATCSIH